MKPIKYSLADDSQVDPLSFVTQGISKINVQQAAAAAVDSTIADNRLYKLLKQEIDAAGCLRPARLASVIHMLVILLAYFSAYLVLLQAPGAGVRIALLIVLAIACVQASFIGHEVGHHGVTRSRRLTQWLGYGFMSFITGYAQTHYLHNHKRHHAHTNDAERDPDIQGAGLVSFFPQSAEEKSGFARWVTKWQAYWVWPLLTLQAFSLKIRGLKLIGSKVDNYAAEKLALALHFGLWFSLPVMSLGLWEAVLNYALVTVIVGVYLGAVVLVNHVGLPMKQAAEPMPFFHHTLTSTRNLGVGRLQDIIFGGQNNHVEHHLFPRISIHKLGVARKITRNFCQRHDIPYHETSWSQAIREVFICLRNISNQAQDNSSEAKAFECQEVGVG